jgi:hypothetical protein
LNVVDPIKPSSTVVSLANLQIPKQECGFQINNDHTCTEYSKRTFDAFLQEYSLSSVEGIVLIGMAEALLWIPDIQIQNLYYRKYGLMVNDLTMWV